MTDRVAGNSDVRAEALADDLMAYFGPHTDDDIALLTVHVQPGPGPVQP